MVKNQEVFFFSLERQDIQKMEKNIKATGLSGIFDAFKLGGRDFDWRGAWSTVLLNFQDQILC